MIQVSPEDKKINIVDRLKNFIRTLINWCKSFRKRDIHPISMVDVNPRSDAPQSHDEMLGNGVINCFVVGDVDDQVITGLHCQGWTVGEVEDTREPPSPGAIEFAEDILESATPEAYASWVAASAGGSSSVGHQDPQFPFDHKYSEHVSSSVDLWHLHRVQRETGIGLPSFLELSDSDQYELISAIQNQPREWRDWSARLRGDGSLPPLDTSDVINAPPDYRFEDGTVDQGNGDGFYIGSPLLNGFKVVTEESPATEEVQEIERENFWPVDTRDDAVFFPGLTRSQAYDLMTRPIKEGLRIDNAEKGEATILYPKERVKNWMLECGFKLKDQGNGVMDLNPYVYDAAIRMIKVGMGIAKMPKVNVELTD